MPIVVDEDFLNRVVTAMDQISGQAPTAANGEIGDLSLHLGHPNFDLGQRLFNAIWQRGYDTQARLNEIGTAARDRAGELNHFLHMTADTEDVAQMTVQQFASQLPTWIGGNDVGG